MAVNANTIETYDAGGLLKRDLSEQYEIMSPEETPFQQLAGTFGETASQPHVEWTLMELMPPQDNNRVVEGDDAPPVDPANFPNQVGNYTQISDKRVKASHTSEASATHSNDVHKLAKQMALKIRELKRDMEVMLLSNVAANPGSSGVARVTAGLPAWIKTNTLAGTGGADPTLSGGTSGHPNVAAVAGTPRPLTEDMFNDAIAEAWTTGGSPTIALVTAGNKRLITDTFTGSATRYKDAVDRTIINAIDVYESDFGDVEIVPTRFMPTLNPAGANNSHYIPLLDPEYVSVQFLETMRQKPLAETGHSRDRLVWCEYLLRVENEAALAVIRDLTNG